MCREGKKVGDQLRIERDLVLQDFRQQFRVSRMSISIYTRDFNQVLIYILLGRMGVCHGHIHMMQKRYDMHRKEVVGVP